jgi:hypothetical protein
MSKHETGYARIERDFYPTPAWVVDALDEHIELSGLRVWECACGDGRMAEALKAAGAIVYATDIEDRGYSGCDGEFDFLSTRNGKPSFDYGAIITNPAYGERNKLAEKFAEAGLQWIAPSGLLALLLTSDFDSGVTRRRLFADCPAFAGKIVLTKRIKWFEPPPGVHKKNPKERHSWFIWRCPRTHARPEMFYAPQHNGATS